MNAKLATPVLGALDEPEGEGTSPPPAVRPDLRSAHRRAEPSISHLVTPGFVTEAVPPPEAAEPTEPLTIEVPRRLKRALQAEVNARRDDPGRRSVASMKSVILEALAAGGYSDLINRSDIEVQIGIFMKRQAAQLRKRNV